MVRELERVAPHLCQQPECATAANAIGLASMFQKLIVGGTDGTR